MTENKIILTALQALSMLPDGDKIHTFRNSNGMLLGADWKRSNLEQVIANGQCEIGGDYCQSMNHGLVIWHDNAPLFVECKKGLDYDSFSTIKTAD